MSDCTCQDMTEVDRITVGEVRRFHKLHTFSKDGQMVTEDRDGELYRVLNFARNGITLQDQVVCVGLDGTDRDRLFVCSLNDFVIHFRSEERPVMEVARMPVTVMPVRDGCTEKVADNSNTEGDKLWRS